MDIIVPTYLIYLGVSAGLTIWVARTLSINGGIFLVNVFRGDETLAASVNHLLVVGFYLINLGYVCLALRMTGDVLSVRESIEALAGKIGTVMLVLGGMHFFNLLVFNRMRVSRPSGRIHMSEPVSE
ncbi:MAG TPA: hypothetical protein VFE05_15425 [Longimicrobiaceae bacterium]|jgi:hypothetical protein|nr:hypothetical protein [Longimicrobiaceae bacterium]